MEINKYTKERLAFKLLKAMNDEHLMNKEVAEIIETDAASMSYMKRVENHDKISQRVWKNIHDWDDSGKPLREYKSPLRKQAEEAEASDAEKIIQEAGKVVDQLLELDPQAPALTSKEKKQKTAQRLRKEFEKSRPSKKEPEPTASKPEDETIILSHEGKKVDLSEIDIRTGRRITIEWIGDKITINIQR